MAPTWLTAVAWTALAGPVASAAVIVVDVYGRGYRQRHMPVMEAVWPLTALYLGPLAVWGYRQFGMTGMARHHERRWERRGWIRIALSVTHCGAGCVLGDIIAEFVIFSLALTIAGEALF